MNLFIFDGYVSKMQTRVSDKGKEYVLLNLSKPLWQPYERTIKICNAVCSPQVSKLAKQLAMGYYVLATMKVDNFIQDKKMYYVHYVIGLQVLGKRGYKPPYFRLGEVLMENEKDVANWAVTMDKEDHEMSIKWNMDGMDFEILEECAPEDVALVSKFDETGKFE